MADGRKCSECGGPLDGKRPDTKTCSARCRGIRSRRQRDERLAGRTVGAVVGAEAEQATQELLREELRPVVREAITQEVLDGIHALIGHVPAAVAVAAELLGSTDEKTRFDAATLILRHTTGNKAVVPDVNAGQGADLTVQFNIPRPTTAEAPDGTGVIETKPCDSCHIDKVLTEFVGSSDRCQECYDSMQATVRRLEDAAAARPVSTES